MNPAAQNLLLADNDADDCMFFEEALEDLPLSAKLATVNDGVELMDFLLNSLENLPDLLFLDLNMPLKTGFECLSEIRRHPGLKHLPVVIFSTSLDTKVVQLLYENGANHYVQKPGEFSRLKKIIHEAITAVVRNMGQQPVFEQFIIQV